MADNIVNPIGNNHLHNNHRASIDNPSARPGMPDTGEPSAQWASSTLSALGPVVNEQHHSVDMTLSSTMTTTKPNHELEKMRENFTNVDTSSSRSGHNTGVGESPLPSPRTPGFPGAYPHTPDGSTTVKGILDSLAEPPEDDDLAYMRAVATSTLGTAKEYAVSAGQTVASAGQTAMSAVGAAGGKVEGMLPDSVAAYLPGSHSTTERNEHQPKLSSNTLLQHPPAHLRSSPTEQDKAKAIAHETGALAAQALVRPPGTQVTQDMRDNAALNPTIGISDANSPSAANTPGVETHPRPLTTAERADSGLLKADFHAGSGSTRSVDDGSLTGASEDASIRTLVGTKTPLEPPTLPAGLSMKSAGFLGPSKLGPGVGSTSTGTGQANSSVYTMHNADGTQKTSSSAAESASVQKALNNLQPEKLEEKLGLGAPPASGLKLRNETLGEKLRDEIKEEEEREEANGGREMDLEREHRERERREQALLAKRTAQEEERPALEEHHREESMKRVPQAQATVGSIDSTVATPGHGSVHGVGLGGSRLVNHQQHQESIDSMVATAGHGHTSGGHGVGLEGKGTVLPSAAREGKGVPDAPLADAQRRAAGTVDRQPNRNEDANMHAKDNSGPMSKVADAAVGKATDVGVRGAGTSHSMDKAKAQGSSEHDQNAQHESKGKQKDVGENGPSSSEKDESSTMHPGVFSSTAGRTHPNTTPPPSHVHKMEQPTTITNPTPYKDDKAVQELYAKRGGAGLIGESTAAESTGKGGHDVGRGEHGASGSGAGGSVGGAGAGGAGGKKPGFMQKLKGEMKVLTGKIEHKADKVQEGRRMMGKN